MWDPSPELVLSQHLFITSSTNWSQLSDTKATGCVQPWGVNSFIRNLYIQTAVVKIRTWRGALFRESLPFTFMSHVFWTSNLFTLRLNPRSGLPLVSRLIKTGVLIAQPFKLDVWLTSSGQFGEVVSSDWILRTLSPSNESSIDLNLLELIKSYDSRSVPICTGHSLYHLIPG